MRGRLTMVAVLALAGDTMLGRLVADHLERDPEVLGPRLREVLGAADAVVLNLECCVSDRGYRWPRRGSRSSSAPRRARGGPPRRARRHRGDAGEQPRARLRAPRPRGHLEHLTAAGVGVVGAGRNVDEARRPLLVDVAGTEVTIVALADHPADFAAGPALPGVAYADLRAGVPDWVTAEVRDAPHPVLVTPHWGPNPVPGPVPHVRSAAEVLTRAGADLIAGHSAHVSHGVAGSVLFDLGDLVDDYAVHPRPAQRPERALARPPRRGGSPVGRGRAGPAARRPDRGGRRRRRSKGPPSAAAGVRGAEHHRDRR
ncbi:CapA family protein [Georgenia muralis]